MVGWASDEEWLAFGLAAPVDGYRGPAVDADPHCSLEFGMVTAQAFDHLTEGRGERHGGSNAGSLVMRSFGIQNDGMEARAVKVDALHVELVEQRVAGTVMSMEEFESAPMTSFGLAPSIRQFCVEVDKVRIDVHSIRRDCSVPRNIDEG